MKETAIKKINTIGKFSYIAAVIAKCFVIVGFVCSMIVAIVCLVTFGDSVKVDVAGQMNLEMDCNKLDISYEDIADGMDEDDMDVKVQTVQVGDASGNTVLSFSDKDFQDAKIEMNDDTLTAQMETTKYTFTTKHVGILMLFSGVAMAMTIVTISFAESLCKAFRDCTSPFDTKVIKKMQNLAISLIPWTIISSIIDSTMDSFLAGGLRLSLSIDLGVVLVVLIVFVLVYIFKYGAVLQQESDETL